MGNQNRMPRPTTTQQHHRTTSDTDERAEQLLDELLQTHMQGKDIGAGAIAISRNGQLVYNKAFGWQDSGRQKPVGHDVIARIASVSKPLTAAAIRELIAQGHFSLDSPVFDCQGSGVGLLHYKPIRQPDPRLADITVAHLLRHQAGWSRDYTFAERQCAEDLGVQHPAPRPEVARWIMGLPLQYAPGTSVRYSNVGYLMLGLIIERFSGTTFSKAVNQLVLEPVGVSSDRMIVGNNMPKDHDLREWNYKGWRGGMWDMDGHCAQGGIVTDPAALLAFTKEFYCGFGTHIGERRPVNGHWKAEHRGGHPGANAGLFQRGDGVDIAVVFNQHGAGASEITSAVDRMLDRGELPWGQNLEGADCGERPF